MYRNQSNKALLIQSIIAVLVTICFCTLVYYEYSVKEELKAEVAEAEAATQNWENYSRQIENWHKSQIASIDSLKEWVSKVQETQSQTSAENPVQANTPVLWALPLCQRQQLIVSHAAQSTMLQNKIFDQFSSNPGVK